MLPDVRNIGIYPVTWNRLRAAIVNVARIRGTAQPRQSGSISGRRRVNRPAGTYNAGHADNYLSQNTPGDLEYHSWENLPIQDYIIPWGNPQREQQQPQTTTPTRPDAENPTQQGTMVCPFCPGVGTAYEEAFNRADVFKRHLTAVHTVEQTPPNRRKLILPSGAGRPGGVGARCNICQSQFATAQEFYEHLDDCVLNVVVPSTPKTAGSGSGSGSAIPRKDSMTRTPTTASTEKGKGLDTDTAVPSLREATEPRADLREVGMGRGPAAGFEPSSHGEQRPEQDSRDAPMPDMTQTDGQPEEHQPAAPPPPAAARSPSPAPPPRHEQQREEAQEADNDRSR